MNAPAADVPEPFHRKIERSWRGEPEATLWLFHWLNPILLRGLRKRTSVQLRSVWPVEDLAQDAWERIWQLHPGSSFETEALLLRWVRKILDHLVFEKAKVLRKRMALDMGGLEEVLAHLASHAPSPLQVLLGRETCDMVYKVLRAMPEPMAQVVVLFSIQRLSVAEVAARLGVSHPVARHRKLRATLYFAIHYRRLAGGADS